MASEEREKSFNSVASPESSLPSLPGASPGKNRKRAAPLISDCSDVSAAGDDPPEQTQTPIKKRSAGLKLKQRPVQNKLKSVLPENLPAGPPKEIVHDDWCAVCQDGGELILCDTCPKIYHIECHVPALPAPPSGDFSCTLCSEMPQTIRCKRAPNKTVMNNESKRLCEKLLLTMYSLPEGEDFHHPVPDEYEEYYEEVTDPIDFGKIRQKLANSPNISGNRGYGKVSQFLDDMNRVFVNALTFNGNNSVLGSIALKFQRALKQHASQILGVGDGRKSLGSHDVSSQSRNQPGREIVTTATEDSQSQDISEMTDEFSDMSDY